MSNLIELESRLCPNCDKSLDRWTLKVVVLDLRLGVRCPACGDFVGLTMKGGEYHKEEVPKSAIEEAVNETLKQMKEE